LTWNQEFLKTYNFVLEPLQVDLESRVSKDMQSVLEPLQVDLESKVSKDMQSVLEPNVAN